MARMAAAPLPPYAWLRQAERFYLCFAARCGRILQGRSATARALGAVLPTRGFAMLSFQQRTYHSKVRKWPRSVEAAIGSWHALEHCFAQLAVK